MQPTRKDEHLVDALDHADPAVRLNAALELARDGRLIAAPALLAALEHDSRVVRRHHVAEHLVMLGPSIVSRLQEAIRSTGRGRAVAAHVLGRIEPSAVGALVPVLIEALATTDLEGRRDALWAIERLGPAASMAVPALVSRLHDQAEAPDVRAATAEAIALALAAVVQVHDAPAIRWYGSRLVGCRVASALARMGATASAAVPNLIRTLGDPRERFDIRMEAARALGSISEPLGPVLQALEQATGDPDWWVRVAAVQGLGLLGDRVTATNRALVAALSDPEGSVRRQAIRAMAMLGDRETAIPYLVALLSDGQMAGLSAEVLALLGEPAVSALAGVIARRGEPAGAFAAYALSRSEAASAQSVPLGGVTAYQPDVAEFLLTGPRIVIDDARRTVFDALVRRTLERGLGGLVAYDLPYPKYEFLQYLVDEREYLVHGTNLQDLELLAPIRWATDPSEVGNLSGVYACADGIWSLYYAVADRTVVGGLRNGARPASTPTGLQTHYHFAFDEAALRKQPWTTGTVYVLSRDSFVDHNGQWVSSAPARPVMRLAVGPADFPYRPQTRGFVPADGWPGERFPWLDSARIYSITPNGYHAECRRLAGLDPVP
jgi:HEAT repeat protein